MQVMVPADACDDLLLRGVPFIDVRSEIEFAQGSIPGAVNLPILTTREREQIGICYKREGQAAAIALGHRLVQGETRVARTARWCEFANQHPGSHLFCWRGGLRSRLASQWMSESGVPVPVITGGYKTLRGRLLHALEEPVAATLCIIGGRTGSAKTQLLRALAGGIDLEAMARHRGSSFGRRAEEPPTQVDFENTLSLALIRRRCQQPEQPIFLEDEGRQIGSIALPTEIFRQMKEAPLAIIEMPLDFRVERILDEYVREDLAAYEARDAVEGFDLYRTRLLDSLDRIRKRLGPERHASARASMEQALDEQRRSGAVDQHRDWIALLLREYYDPMYEYQLGRAAERIAFRGSYEDVREWCSLKLPVSGRSAH